MGNMRNAIYSPEGTWEPTPRREVGIERNAEVGMRNA
jgi:hypothetical protein